VAPSSSFSPVASAWATTFSTSSTRIIRFSMSASTSGEMMSFTRGFASAISSSQTSRSSLAFSLARFSCRWE